MRLRLWINNISVGYNAGDGNNGGRGQNIPVEQQDTDYWERPHAADERAAFKKMFDKIGGYNLLGKLDQHTFAHVRSFKDATIDLIHKSNKFYESIYEQNGRHFTPRMHANPFFTKAALWFIPDSTG